MNTKASKKSLRETKTKEFLLKWLSSARAVKEAQARGAKLEERDDHVVIVEKNGRTTYLDSEVWPGKKQREKIWRDQIKDLIYERGR